MKNELWIVFEANEESQLSALENPRETIVLDAWLTESESAARGLAEEMAADDQDNWYSIAKVIASCKVDLHYNWTDGKKEKPEKR